MKDKIISRRAFLGSSALALGGLALSSVPQEASAARAAHWVPTSKSTFSMWQCPSHKNDIGNTYVFRTKNGKVVVMDGGRERESYFLRGLLALLGNEVEAWFISHPHDDHMQALNTILKDPQEIKINHIYHSRLSEENIKLDGESEKCVDFYNTLAKTQFPVTDVQEPGLELNIDGMNIKVLGVANHEIHTNVYNNNSMILRVWDNKKSLVFLGDAGIECGDKVLKGQYKDLLNCDYLQMAHHGQAGCSEQFYKSIKFRACLWSTPIWVWNHVDPRLKTGETRRWMDEIGIKEHHVSSIEGIYRLD